jgi:hypothetical protein
MPVGVPQIEPSADGGGLPGAPSLDPGSFAARSTSGLRSVARGLGEVAESAEDTATWALRAKAAQARVDEELQKEQDALAADRAENLYKLDVANAAAHHGGWEERAPRRSIRRVRGRAPRRNLTAAFAWV